MGRHHMEGNSGLEQVTSELSVAHVSPIGATEAVERALRRPMTVHLRLSRSLTPLEQRLVHEHPDLEVDGVVATCVVPPDVALDGVVDYALRSVSDLNPVRSAIHSQASTILARLDELVADANRTNGDATQAMAPVGSGAHRSVEPDSHPSNGVPTAPADALLEDIHRMVAEIHAYALGS